MGWGRMAPRHRAVGCLCASGSSSSSAPTVWCSAFSMSFRWRCLWVLWRRVASFLVGAGHRHSAASSSLRSVAASCGRVAHLEPLLPLRVPCGLRGGTARSAHHSSEFLPALIMQAWRPLLFRCIARHGLLGYQPGHQRRAFPDIWAGFSHSTVGFLLGNLVEWRCTKTSFSIPRPSPSSVRRCSSCLCSSPST